MEDKKQDVNVLEELSKAADDFRKWAVDFGDKLSKILDDIKALKKEEDTWEMKIPYKYGDDYYYIQSSGDVFPDCWYDTEADNRYFSQGNTFPTKEAAELEAKRRNLLTRFRAFRDECNGSWDPNFRNFERKYFIIFSSDSKNVLVDSRNYYDYFNLFGYFKNESDAQEAIELFGDEIKALFVDCEG